MGSVAKSCMRKGFLIYEEMRKYLTIYEETLVIYDFATAPFWILIYEENFLFFLSVYARRLRWELCAQTILETRLVSSAQWKVHKVSSYGPQMDAQILSYMDG